jgi:hypothetical protein
MDGVREVALRVLAGSAVYAAVALSFARAVPLLAHAVLGTVFALAFVIFGQPLIIGFGSPRLRRYVSYGVAAVIVSMVGYVLLFLREFTAGG